MVTCLDQNKNRINGLDFGFGQVLKEGMALNTIHNDPSIAGKYCSAEMMAGIPTKNDC